MINYLKVKTKKLEKLALETVFLKIEKLKKLKNVKKKEWARMEHFAYHFE